MVLDVGQGDCTIAVDRESGFGILIDCPSVSVEKVIRHLRHENVQLHTAVVTHWDLDHYGGIGRVAKAVRPQFVCYNHDTMFEVGDRQKFRRTTLQAFLDLAPHGVTLNGIRAGDEMQVGRLALRFLAPTQEELTRAYLLQTRNLASCVCILVVEELRLIVGGDAVADTWARLLRDQEHLSADVLRWPHHGAMLHGDHGGDIARGLLDAVDPTHLVISAGASNRHGHPAGEVVRAASRQGLRTMCTQVTPGCFGFETRRDRLTTAASATTTSLADKTCAGTVTIRVTGRGFTIGPSPQVHRQRINLWPQPLCIECAATTT